MSKWHRMKRRVGFDKSKYTMKKPIKKENKE
jgi:hypothetical protein